MAVELVPAKPEHVAQISRIAYKSFLGISSRHGFPPDFPNAESAKPVYDLLIQRDDYIGLVALINGRPVGSNFVMKSDRIAAIGPLSVDPSVQGHGVGRLLMTSILALAAVQQLNDVRLLQDTYNATALALYSSLGFEVRDTVALMHTSPSDSRDPFVRPIRSSDFEEIDRISSTLFNASRRNEVLIGSQYGFQTYIREREGRATGYLVPGLVGHGVYETEEDALALLTSASELVTPHFRKFLCPLRQSDLFQKCLKAGWRIEKLLTYMTLGPYEYPKGIWTPSACY